MKHLNKIIFINSANIPYAEISVDGNVHFTGTQGVGKSTVLRALLFFYNADKHRLGIQQGQKTFDEFYFRQSNSHILYEVMRDNGAYTILVSRYQGAGFMAIHRRTLSARMAHRRGQAGAERLGEDP